MFTQPNPDEITELMDTQINLCVQVLPKFLKDSSQYSLLINRIEALNIAKAVLLNDENHIKYSKEQLTTSLEQVTTLLTKSEKVVVRFKPGHPAHVQLTKTIKVLKLAESKIKNATEHRITSIFKHYKQ